MPASFSIEQLWDARYRGDVNFPTPSLSRFFEASWYGKLGTADDTSVLQAAIDDCFTSGGGFVSLPGQVLMFTQLVMKDGVTIVGAGEGERFVNSSSGKTSGTILRSVLGSTSHMIVQATGFGTLGSPGLYNLTLDGNNGSNFASPAQTPNAFDGINFSAQVVRFKIQDVTIYGVPRDAINCASGVSMGGAFFTNVSIEFPYRHGVNHQGADIHYHAIEVNNPGQNSFILAGTQGIWTNCKSNGSGQLQLGGATQNGYNITGSSHILGACSSENDWLGNGFYVSGVRNKIHGTASGAGNALLYLDGCTRNDIDLLANNQFNHNSPNYIYQVNGSATKTNRVHIHGNPTFLTSYSTLSNSGSEAGNTFVCENEEPLGFQSVAFASSLTPDPYLGGTIKVGTLTGAVTMNAPTNGHAGSRLTFHLTQDATGGRVVTWNAAYKLLSTLTTTANSITIISFLYDGTTWYELSIDHN